MPIGRAMQIRTITLTLLSLVPFAAGQPQLDLNEDACTSILVSAG
ncbi:MAG: hypothetical protein ACI8QC_003288, partial [Planctomycetota bacterium]